MAANLVTVDGILFNEFAKYYDEHTFTVHALSTSSWRDVLQSLRMDTVIAAEGNDVDIYCVTQLPANRQGWVNTNANPVQLHDQLPQGDSLRVIVHVTKQFSGAKYAWTRAFQRTESTYTASGDSIGTMLAEYEIETPVTDGANGSVLERQYLRPEDKHVWDILYKHARRGKTAPPLALLGSPGCGKSTMTQRLAYTMSSDHGCDVIYFQHIAGGQTKVHLFTPTTTCVSGIIYDGAIAKLIKLFSVIEGRELEPYIIVDGFSDVKAAMLENYNLLVSSRPFNDSRMGSSVVLLPSWSLDHVLQLGEQANVVAKSEIKKRYELYGGDLQSIYNENEDAALRSLHWTLRRVSGEDVTPLWSNFCLSSSNQVDRLRRYRVEDPEHRSLLEPKPLDCGH